MIIHTFISGHTDFYKIIPYCPSLVSYYQDTRSVFILVLFIYFVDVRWNLRTKMSVVYRLLHHRALLLSVKLLTGWSSCSLYRIKVLVIDTESLFSMLEEIHNNKIHKR